MSNYTIQTGVWVNYNNSPVSGATLTVPIRWGNYLIAALSSLVAWAGTRAWAILAFYLHQRLAAKHEKDVLHQQLQVHFRTGASFFDSIVDGVDLYRAWAGRVRGVKRRTLGLVLCAICFLLAFTAAGVFVAEVATNSYSDVLVLASPSDCGDLVWSIPEGGKSSSEYVDAVGGYEDDLTLWSRNYARDAYNGSTPSTNVFPNPTLPLLSRYVPCPYENGTTCLGANDTQGMAYLVETGELDSHLHFGMNAPESDRITFSKSVTCAVVDPANLTTIPYTRTQEIHGHQLNVTYIGILQQFGPDLGADSNLVFEVDANLVYERVGFFAQRALYQLGLLGPDKALTAPPFARDDADITLVTVTQGDMFYYTPVDDPVYLAHEATTGDDYAYSLNTTVYYSSKKFALMSCTEQNRFCNPRNGRCTDKTGLMGVKNSIYDNTLDFNKAQWATAMRIFSTLSPIGNFGMVVAHGTSGLLVAEKNGVRGGTSVPPDQWTKEVEMWFATNLAAIQSGLLRWVTKPWPTGQPEVDYPMVNLTGLGVNYDARNLTPQKDTLCKSQLIRSTAAVQNFSILALVLVIVVSLTLIITSLVLPSCVSWSRSRRLRRCKNLSRAAEAGRIARLADSKYALLGMALQNAGLGEWKLGKGDIPVTSEQVTVCSPIKDEGLPTYPCTACHLCKTRSPEPEKTPSMTGPANNKTTTNVSVVDKALSITEEDIRAIKLPNDWSEELSRRSTDLTLVSTPATASVSDDPAGDSSDPNFSTHRGQAASSFNGPSDPSTSQTVATNRDIPLPTHEQAPGKSQAAKKH